MRRLVGGVREGCRRFTLGVVEVGIVVVVAVVVEVV